MQVRECIFVQEAEAKKLEQLVQANNRRIVSLCFLHVLAISDAAGRAETGRCSR